MSRSLSVLTRTEVSFSVELEPEDMELEGHFDDEAEREIRARLEREQQEAWCWIGVTAKWQCPKTGKVYTATRGVGGCSLDAGYPACGEAVARLAEAYAKEHELFDEALDALNEHLRDVITEAGAIMRYLADKEARRVARAAGRAKENWRRRHGLPCDAEPVVQPDEVKP
jgi:hypothetical protein